MNSARKLAERGLVWCGVDRWAVRRRRGQVIVLAYHNIVPDDAPAAGDRSLHLQRNRFAEHLDVLLEFYDVIPLKDILSPRPRDARAAVAVTFDDAYRGALTLGAAELQVRGLAATMFAAPGLLGGDSFWWDALAGAADLSPDVRGYALGELRGDGATVRAWATSVGLPVQEMPAWGRPGTESELAAWVSVNSFPVAVHTWRHANLSRLTGNELSDELAKPLTWLRNRFGANVLPWLTYPYGFSTSAAAIAARALGYEAALAATGGWLPQPITDPYLLPRVNIPAGLTADGLRLRLAGTVGRPVASAQHSDEFAAGSHS
jgi:peptidoglycan/xylan/chitin deacetylase (PgdA/CDA1 family)